MKLPSNAEVRMMNDELRVELVDKAHQRTSFLRAVSRVHHSSFIIHHSVLILLLVAFLCSNAFGANKALLERERDGSRSDAVHRIPLYDMNGEKIAPDDILVLPFSTKFTCGECHDYGKIRLGRHFDSLSTTTLAGRPGEPWVLTDERTGIQLPLSNRGWAGTWRPSEIGLSSWGFVKAFGSHLPGGDMGEREIQPEDPAARWEVSGNLEINCLACHSGAHYQDQAAWADQIKQENFVWAATAASGMASVEGTVIGLPALYDIYRGPDPDKLTYSPPRVDYYTHLFDRRNWAFFDVAAKPSNNRCYFCHSSKTAGGNMWRTDPDVHLAAGMNCVDCHRNGLDHRIVRGYEGEAAERKDPALASLSCEGCHLGEAFLIGPDGLGGRLGAPRPEHKGLPAIHLEKMTCTVCHSGPWPETQTRQIRTARAHHMGEHASRPEPQLPQFAGPVYARIGEGKIGLYSAIWPSFWGEMRGGKVVPLLPDKVYEKAGAILSSRDDNNTTGTERILTDKKIAGALKALGEGGKLEAVYVAGGKLHRLGGDGKLAAADHASAEPYYWAAGHDVRAAGHSLGAKSCEDCHSADAPFFFAQVRPLSPLSTQVVSASAMKDLQGKDVAVFVRTSWFFKWLIIITMSLLVLHILGDLFRRFMRRITPE